MNKFRKNEKSKNIIIISLIVIIGILLVVDFIKSHAYFETGKTYNVLEGQVPNFAKGDVTLAVVIDGQVDKSGIFPNKKNHRYVERDDVCTNGATLEWDKINWQAIVTAKNATVCTLRFETIDNSLNGSEPVIKDGLVPVIIVDDGTVTKTSEDDSNWYNYNDAKWANAVLLTGTDNYQVGQTIPEDKIESYFVWIPKYRYKLWDMGLYDKYEDNITENKYRIIDIVIGDYDTKDAKDECVAPNKSAESGTCSIDKWMTHPAFTSFGVNGFWVGKFTTTGSTSKVTVKPNNTIIGNLSQNDMFATSYNYKRNLDSHMMKNTEWGAVAYLSNSEYGKGIDEIWINPTDVTTVCIGNGPSDIGDQSCINKWNTEKGYHGSTTNNISGIYDMSGGAWEFTAADVDDDKGFPITYGRKYVDKYNSSETKIAYYNRILGDATGELGPFYNNIEGRSTWYDDWGQSLSVRYPTSFRGGEETNITGAGILHLMDIIDNQEVILAFV